MDILITNGTIFQKNSFSGGAELSIEYLAKYLSKNHKVKVLTGHKSKIIRTLRINENFAIVYLNDKQFSEFLDQELSSEYYDYVFTQLIWSEFTMKACSKHGIPCVYFVRSFGIKIDLSSKNPDAPSILVGNTYYVQKKLKQIYSRKPLMLYPCIDFDRVRSKFRVNPRFIGMFNPVKVKGGEIFGKITISNPSKKFIAVRGWTNLKDDNNNWDMDKMMQMTRAHGEEGAYSPEEPDLSGLKNLKIVNSTPTPGKIFSALKILLVPSLWEETFCRTMLEAMSNGIPVIATSKGGILEALRFGKGAYILVKDVKNINEWNKAINTLFSDKDLYERLSLRAKGVTDNFNTDRNIDSFIFDLIKIKKESVSSGKKIFQ